MQVLYDGVRRENEWPRGRECHARRYTRGFQEGRGTEVNLFMLERMIEMVKVREECLFVYSYGKSL